MQINTERLGGTLVMEAWKRVDSTNARDFENAFRAAIEDNDQAVVVDLSNLAYISSAGLRAILVTAKTLKKRNAGFALCSPSNTIKAIFQISGFDKIIPMYASRDEALSAVGSQQAPPEG